jgi:hypothetical protein
MEFNVKNGNFCNINEIYLKNREKWIDATVKKLPVKAVGKI